MKLEEGILALQASPIGSVGEAAANGGKRARSVFVDPQSFFALRAAVLVDKLAVGDDRHWHHRHTVALRELEGSVAGNAVEVLVVGRTSDNSPRAKSSDEVEICRTDRACASILDQAALDLPVLAEIGGGVKEKPSAAGDADTGVVELRAAVRSLRVGRVKASSRDKSVV